MNLPPPRKVTAPMTNQDRSQDQTYETETMAELCARQGRLGEAIAIYRRLAESAPDAATRARCRQRLETLEATWQPLRDAEAPPADVPIPPAPGVAVEVGDDQVTVAWAVPAGTAAPALDLLVLQRTPAGVEANKKILPLETPTGRLGLAAPAIHSALAAVGRIVEGRFVPLARSRR
jgi:hypothetical protein